MCSSDLIVRGQFANHLICMKGKAMFLTDDRGDQWPDSADEEELLIVAQANEPLDEEGHFLNEKVAARGVGGEIAMFPKSSVDMMVSVGDRLKRDDLIHRLEQAGYQHTVHITSKGEYAARGSIIDLYPMNAPDPIRLEWFDDDIDSIRTFAVDSQLTLEKHPHISILPRSEIDHSISDDKSGISVRDLLPQISMATSALSTASRVCCIRFSH